MQTPRQIDAPPLTSSTHPAVAGLVRSIIIGLVLVAIASALAGCGGGDAPPDVPTPAVLCNTQPPVCT